METLNNPDSKGANSTPLETSILIIPNSVQLEMLYIIQAPQIDREGNF